MRAFVGLSFAAVLLLFVAPGCGPELSEDDLGTVIYELKQIPGADKPVFIPDGPPQAAESERPPVQAPDGSAEPATDDASPPKGDE